jgi:hypothetical protein
MNVFANRFVFVRLVCESFRFLFIFESFRLFVSATIKKNPCTRLCGKSFCESFRLFVCESFRVCSFGLRIVSCFFVCESFRLFVCFCEIVQNGRAGYN